MDCALGSTHTQPDVSVTNMHTNKHISESDDDSVQCLARGIIQRDYVTLPPGTNLLDYLARPYGCRVDGCPHRYGEEGEIRAHEEGSSH
jgi:hypothetical protein